MRARLVEGALDLVGDIGDRLEMHTAKLFVAQPVAMYPYPGRHAQAGLDLDLPLIGNRLGAAGDLREQLLGGARAAQDIDIRAVLGESVGALGRDDQSPPRLHDRGPRGQALDGLI